LWLVYDGGESFLIPSHSTSAHETQQNKEQCDSSGGVNESETDNRKRERKTITSGGGSGLSGLIFLCAIAIRSRKEEIGESE
jgi:hypothetical protein